MTVTSARIKHGHRLAPAMLGLALALLAATGGTARAEDLLKQGVRVGTRIPHNLAAKDQDGHLRNFRSIRGKRGLLLLFNRSFEW